MSRTPHVPPQLQQPTLQRHTLHFHQPSKSHGTPTKIVRPNHRRRHPPSAPTDARTNTLPHLNHHQPIINIPLLSSCIIIIPPLCRPKRPGTLITALPLLSTAPHPLPPLNLVSPRTRFSQILGTVPTGAEPQVSTIHAIAEPPLPVRRTRPLCPLPTKQPCTPKLRFGLKTLWEKVKKLFHRLRTIKQRRRDRRERAAEVAHRRRVWAIVLAKRAAVRAAGGVPFVVEGLDPYPNPNPNPVYGGFVVGDVRGNVEAGDRVDIELGGEPGEGGRSRGRVRRMRAYSERLRGAMVKIVGSIVKMVGSMGTRIGEGREISFHEENGPFRWVFCMMVFLVVMLLVVLGALVVVGVAAA